MATYFLHRFAKECKKNITGFGDAAKDLLLDHNYPGNIRELRNIIHYAVIMCTSETIESEHLPLENNPASCQFSEKTFKSAKQKVVEQFEKEFLLRRLEETKGNITQAAHNAGMYKKNFMDKMNQYGIKAKDMNNKD